MIMLIIKSLYFFLPAYFANAAPVLGKGFMKKFAYPIDFGKKLNGKQILGSHKTWRGVLLAVVSGTLIFYVQKIFYSYAFFQNISLIDYSQYPLSFGFLMGFGAIFGDSVKSFFKRRLGIKPGGRWIPFDQLDYVIGALLFCAIAYVPPLQVILVIVIASFVIHIISNHLAYALRIKNVKW